MFTILPTDDAKAAVLAQREQQIMPLSALLLTVDGEEQGYALFRVERDVVNCCACGRRMTIWQSG